MIKVLEIIASILGLLATLAPRFIGKGETTTLSHVLRVAETAIQVGTGALAELEALDAQLKAMVAADRDPTEDEWTALWDRSAATHKAIVNTVI